MLVSGGVKILAGGQACFGKQRFVPALANDPLTGRGDGRLRAHQRHQRCNRRTVFHLQARELDAHLEHMVVRVIEAGYNRAPRQVYLARACTGQRPHRVVFANCNNAAVLAGQRRAARQRRMQRMNGAVVNDQVRCAVVAEHVEA